MSALPVDHPFSPAVRPDDLVVPHMPVPLDSPDRLLAVIHMNDCGRLDSNRRLSKSVEWNAGRNDPFQESPRSSVSSV